jgi:hypothetical protein
MENCKIKAAAIKELARGQWKSLLSLTISNNNRNQGKDTLGE